MCVRNQPPSVYWQGTQTLIPQAVKIALEFMEQNDKTVQHQQSDKNRTCHSLRDACEANITRC